MNIDKTSMNNLGPSILIIGATGNVGKHCLNKLLELIKETKENNLENIKIFLATRDPEKFSSNFSHPNNLENKQNSQNYSFSIQPIKCDSANPLSIAEVISQTEPSRVFISMPQILSPENMINCGKACIDACLKSNVKRLIRLSSLGIENQIGQGPLGDAHKTIEEYAREKISKSNSTNELKLISIRPTSFHTNILLYDKDSIVNESCFRSPLGKNAKVNWVHCKDIGNVSAVLLLKPEGDKALKEIIEVTGPKENSIGALEMSKILSEELGREINYEEVASPPFEGLKELWVFLREGGFDVNNYLVEEITGKNAISFREIIKELKPFLV